MKTETTKTPTISTEVHGPHLVLNFSNGKTIEVDATTISAEIQRIAMFHGLKQKLVDAAAISRNPATGRPASIDDKFAAVKTVADRITDKIAPSWNAIREGGSTGGGILLAALIRMHDGRKTREQLQAWLDTKTGAEISALRKNPKVAAIIATIQVERGNVSDIDTDSMLDEMGEL